MRIRVPGQYLQKEEWRGDHHCSVTLALTKGNKKEIAKVIKERIAYRKERHPLDYPNIGSIFKNVPLATMHKKTSEQYKKALRDAALALRGSKFSVKTDPFPVISAAKLISESGLRGVSAGGAMISPKHPNFIVNVLAAGSADVENLITLAKAKVSEKVRHRSWRKRYNCYNKII